MPSARAFAFLGPNGELLGVSPTGYADALEQGKRAGPVAAAVAAILDVRADWDPAGADELEVAGYRLRRVFVAWR